MSKQTYQDRRRAELARIHIAAEELGMDTKDDDPNSDYRCMLWTIGRVRSAGELDAAGRRKVLDHLRALGAPPAPESAKRNFPGRPHNMDSVDRGPMLRKIEAYLTEAKRPWSYVDTMAYGMFQVDRIGFCTPAQLHKIIAALDIDARRHGRYRGPKAS